MIVKRSQSAGLEDSIFVALCAVFANCSWTIYEPEFIVFASEEEHIDREMELASGHSAYRVSSVEMLYLVTEGKIGFDWTDVSIKQHSNQVGIEVLACYLQCVDAKIWYVWTDEEKAIESLSRIGFTATSSDYLPFPMHDFQSSE